MFRAGRALRRRPFPQTTACSTGRSVSGTLHVHGAQEAEGSTATPSSVWVDRVMRFREGVNGQSWAIAALRNASRRAASAGPVDSVGVFKAAVASQKGTSRA